MNHVIWVEKYRPHTIADCILPEYLKNTFQKIVDSGVVPNMILHGKAGGGKTSVARAICEELGIEYLVINASKDGNIDTLRNEILDFSSSRSYDGERKVIILDEADHLNPTSTQPALRNFIEEFAANVSFIYTANVLGKILEPLHSRASIIEFKVPANEKETLLKQFMKRCRFILDTEGITYEPKVLAALIVKFWPDFRRTINELQTHALNGVIDESILEKFKDVSMGELLKTIKARDFFAMRKWCAVHHDTDPVRVMRKIYDSMSEVFDKMCLPDVVLLIGQYQYQAAFVADHEMHLAAFLTDLMQTVEFPT